MNKFVALFLCILVATPQSLAFTRHDLALAKQGQTQTLVIARPPETSGALDNIDAQMVEIADLSRYVRDLQLNMASLVQIRGELINHIAKLVENFKNNVERDLPAALTACGELLELQQTLLKDSIKIGVSLILSATGAGALADGAAGAAIELVFKAVKYNVPGKVEEKKSLGEAITDKVKDAAAEKLASLIPGGSEIKTVVEVLKSYNDIRKADKVAQEKIKKLKTMNEDVPEIMSTIQKIQSSINPQIKFFNNLSIETCDLLEARIEAIEKAK